MLLMADLIGIALAYSLAYALRLNRFEPEQIFSGLVLSFVLINLACLYIFDLYSIDPQTPLWKKPLQTLSAVFIAGCVIILVTYLSGAVLFSGIIGRGVLIGAQVLFAFWAAGQRFWVSKWLRKTAVRSRMLVVGTIEYVKHFVNDLRESRLAGQFTFLTPEGDEIDFDTTAGGRKPSKSPLTLAVQGSWNDLERLSLDPWTGIIVCAGNQLPESLVETLMDIRLRGIRVVDLADFYEQTWLKVPVFYLQRSWFAMAQGFQLLHNPIGLRLKRLFDILGASLLLAITSPILLLTALAIKLESRGPVIYRQTRVGENGKLFTVIKLRSMRTDAEKHGAAWTVQNDPRVTRIGSFIRATRIDELPQLLNVLRGEMSFIGPRPERPEFMDQLEHEIPFYNLRHILKPGVTGWAQVMYPYGASVEDARQKLQYELYYIKNYSLLLDTAIVFKTIRVVLFGQGR
jgi:sugar transferase (PEP-CTERM system associated)